MLKEGIQYLLSLAAAGEANPDTFIPVERLRDDVSLHSLEEYGDCPMFQRLYFRTARITDFNAYLAAESQHEQTAVFIDPEGGGATAIIDLGNHETPQWKRHRAMLKMAETPEFKALKAACERPLSQRDMVTFLEDYHYCITPAIRKSGSETVEGGSVAQAIQIVRKLEVKTQREIKHEEGDFSNRADGMESIDMRGRDGNELVSLAFACQPYDDTQSRRIDVRLMKYTEGDKPGLKLRIAAPDKINRDVQEEIETDIADAQDDVRIFVGAVDVK